MEKEKYEKYIETIMLIVGVAVFSFIMYFACQVGYAIIKAIF